MADFADRNGARASGAATLGALIAVGLAACGGGAEASLRAESESPSAVQTVGKLDDIKAFLRVASLEPAHKNSVLADTMVMAFVKRIGNAELAEAVLAVAGETAVSPDRAAVLREFATALKASTENPK